MTTRDKILNETLTLYSENGFDGTSVEQIAESIGADSLGYLPLEDLKHLCGSGDYCSACFSGSYPTAIPEDTRKDQFEQKLSQRKERDTHGTSV